MTVAAQPGMPVAPNLVYQDRPEISETFADSLENIMMDGPTLRLEFVINRFDKPKPPAPPTGKKYTACRLVLPAPALIELAAKLNQVLAALQAQGIVKPVAPAPI